MVGKGKLITPHGSIESSIDNLFPQTFTLKLEADTAKTLSETDFGSIDTHTNSFAVVIDQLRRSKSAEVKMHQTAAEDDITTAEAAVRFGPLMTKGIGDRLYPISVPFQHDHGTGVYLTFIADNDCTILGRVLQVTS